MIKFNYSKISFKINFIQFFNLLISAEFFCKKICVYKYNFILLTTFCVHCSQSDNLQLCLYNLYFA